MESKSRSTLVWYPLREITAKPQLLGQKTFGTMLVTDKGFC
jgi:hypothetical protein